MNIKGLWNFTKRMTVNAVNVMLQSDSVGVLPDVDLTGIAVDDGLKWDGSKLVKTSSFGGGGGTFGSEAQNAASDSQSSTSSSSFVQKLRLTTGSLPSGTYRVGYSYEWRHSSTTSDFRGRVQVNDSTTLAEYRQEPQDAGSDQYHSHSGFGYYTGSGVLNIDLDYCASGESSAYIRRARLEIWRVS